LVEADSAEVAHAAIHRVHPNVHVERLTPVTLDEHGESIEWPEPCYNERLDIAATSELWLELRIPASAAEELLGFLEPSAEIVLAGGKGLPDAQEEVRRLADALAQIVAQLTEMTVGSEREEP